MFRPELHLPRLAALAAGLFACTDVELRLPTVDPEPEPQIAPNQAKGTFCTEDPATLVFPLKVWFVIDDTGSMCPDVVGPDANDPNKKRYSAAKDLAAAKGQPGSVYFGGMTFADRGGDIKVINGGIPRFTDDVAKWNAGIDAVTNCGKGGTPYGAALARTEAELRQDVLDDPKLARRTRYVIIFLSDGEANDEGIADPFSYAVDKTKLVMSLKDKVGEIQLNTILLGGKGEALLRKMAEIGNGIFVSFPNGDQLDYSGFDFSQIRRSYVHRNFMLINRSMLPSADGPLIDSDADGLADKEEKRLGTDPQHADTDSDGCDDLMEINSGWDPRAVKPGECVCSQDEKSKDEDNDQLSNCVEKWLATDPLDVDSDRGKDTPGDLVPDKYDYIYFGDPKNFNSGDLDADGILDIQELQAHTSARDDEGTFRAKWAYKYSLKQQAAEPRCYDFTVDNVTLGQTLAADGRLAGENLIEFFFAESPGDNASAERIFRVGRKVVPYSPGGALLNVDRADFSDLIYSGVGEQ